MRGYVNGEVLHNQDYDELYGTWNVDGKPVPVASTYRVAWRAMAATTGFRTLYPALIPPAAKHIHTVSSAGPVDSYPALLAAISASSLVSDFLVRSTGAAFLTSASFENLPLLRSAHLNSNAVRLYLRLNCLTFEYSGIWEHFIGEKWSAEIPLRQHWERKEAQAALDVICGISFGISIEELLMIYRTQFPVMRRYDQEVLFDANGRKVPKEIVRKQLALAAGSSLTSDELTWEHPQSKVNYTFEYPFRNFDRERVMQRLFNIYNNPQDLPENSA